MPNHENQLGLLKKQLGISFLEDHLDIFVQKLLDYMIKQNQALNDWRGDLAECLSNQITLELDSFEKDQKEYVDNKIISEIKKATEELSGKFSTKTVSYSSKEISTLLRVLETSGFGIIDQILFIAPSNDYEIYIMIDDNLLFNKPYSYFSDYSDYVQYASAFYNSDTSKYYFSMRNVNFQKNIMINLKTTSSITFDEILVRYTIKNEIKNVSRQGVDHGINNQR